MQMRGPGDLYGTMQSGLLQLKIANLIEDGDILQLARNSAIQIFKKDPELNDPSNAPMLNYLKQKSRKQLAWSRIS